MASREDVIGQIAEKVAVISCARCGQELDVSEQPFFAIVQCPKCRARQPVPARLGNFLLLELLGKGGMAGVYRAYDERLGRQVAIKVMRRELGEDPKFLESFLQEARAAARLNHRNIVSIYAVGEEKGQPYIVMELLDGGRFDQMIAAQKDIDEVRVLEIAIDVAQGLKAAHDAGLVHGDVKPANILFDRSGTAKVADFGLAKFERRDSSKKEKEKREIWGTPYYIAPEKIRRQKEDHRSDIYSLGATLYHALGGRPPFEGETATDVVLARLKEPPIRLSDIRPNIHPKTADVIARMLEPEPAMRYPTYESLIADLKAALREVQLGPFPSAEKKGKKKAIPVSVWVSVAIIALMAVTLIAAVMSHQRRQRPPPIVVPPPIETAAEHPAPAVPTPEPEREEEPSAPETAPRPSSWALQPFRADEQRTIAVIVPELLAPRGGFADTRWAAFVRGLPADHGGRPWGTVFYALAPWLNGDQAETERRLSALADMEFPSSPEGAPHPGVLARAAARFMLGRPMDLPAAPADGWPAWFDDFMLFLQAHDHFRSGRPAEGAAAIEAYLGRKSDDPSWPYAFQLVARRWKERVDEWARFRGQIAQRLERGEADAVLVQLERWKADPLAARFMAGLDDEIARVRAFREERRAEEERRRAEAERAARVAKLQEELDRIDERRGEVMPLLHRRDFRQAVERLRELEPELSLDDSRQVLRLAIEACERMEGLRPFLMRAVSEAPFTGARGELRGDVVAARSSGVLVRLAGGAGEIERRWESLSPRVFADMAAYYAGRATGSPETRADLLLAAALYVYHLGAFRQATALAESAVRAHPPIAPTVRRLMPGILPDS